MKNKFDSGRKENWTSFFDSVEGLRGINIRYDAHAKSAHDFNENLNDIVADWKACRLNEHKETEEDEKCGGSWIVNCNIKYLK